MSSTHFIISDLQSLVTETRRRHIDVKEAVEKALLILRAEGGGKGDLSGEGPHAADLISPILLGMRTKNQKVLLISIGALQRLVSLKAVAQETYPILIKELSAAVHLGVDIQLKVLQALLVILTGDINGDLLGDAFRICFELRDSRIPVVSSTAAATLRQGVMVTFDKVTEEDKLLTLQKDEMDEEAAKPNPALDEIITELPDGTKVGLHKASKDAFDLFQDLCLLTAATSGSAESGNKEDQQILKLEKLPKAFGLELIESILSNYVGVFALHAELLLLLRHHLSPLLLRLLSSSPHFPLTLRLIRVVFLLLRSFGNELAVEIEVFLGLLIKIVASDQGEGEPVWMRVLGMECLRGLCADAAFLRMIWTRYPPSTLVASSSSKEDGAMQKDNTTHIFTNLISTFNRIATERPSLMGTSAQMHGIGVHPGESADGGNGGDDPYRLGQMAGMVASGMSTVVASLTEDRSAGLGPSSQVKVQCIDQLDKTESPILPETYLYLLTFQCLNSIAEGLSSVVVLFDQEGEAEEETGRAEEVKCVREMAEAGWPALLASLSFFMGTNLSDDLFTECLSALSGFTNVCGLLHLNTERDAFLSTISRFAVPPSLVSALAAYDSPQTPKTPSVMNTVEAFGLSALTGSSNSAIPPSLSQRNLACLGILLNSIEILADTLGNQTWYEVLETLQSASFVLAPRRQSNSQISARKVTPNPAMLSPSIRSSSSNNASGTSGWAGTQEAAQKVLVSSADADAINTSINNLFESTVANLKPEAFTDFITALCRLGGDVLGLGHASSSSVQSPALPQSPTIEVSPPELLSSERRRPSGMNFGKSSKTYGDRSFAITRLGQICVMNLRRLLDEDLTMSWSVITSHLIVIVRQPIAPSQIRIQAANVLDDFLTASIGDVVDSEDLPRQSKVQKLVFDSIERQVEPFTSTGVSQQTDVDIRRLALEALHQILQGSGHSLSIGWETVFSCLQSVCAPRRIAENYSDVGTPRIPDGDTLDSPTKSTISLPRRSSIMPTSATSTKGNAVLVRTAFQSVTLVTTDFLSFMDVQDLALCVSALSDFARQTDDVNIALASIGSLWNVSDAVQLRRSSENEELYNRLWLSILRELLGACLDSRAEVRTSSLQTLFRSIELYGSSFPSSIWTDVIWDIVFPLFDSIDAFILGLSPSDEPDSIAFPSESTQWQESKILALQSSGSIISMFFNEKLAPLADAKRILKRFVSIIKTSFLSGSHATATGAARSFQKVLTVFGQVDNAIRNTFITFLWNGWLEMGQALVRQPKDGQPPISFTQENLKVYLECLAPLYQASTAYWDMGRFKAVLPILKGVLIQIPFDSTPSDVDNLTPVQAAVFSCLELLQLSFPGSASLMLQDLSIFITLAYSQLENAPMSTGETKKLLHKVTYVAVSKKAMASAVEVLEQHQGDLDIFTSSSMEQLINAYSLPIKLKYDCPPPSRYGDAPPLWKTATDAFLKVLKICVSTLSERSADITDERHEGIWSQLLCIYSGSLLADCSEVENLNDNQQALDEEFDLRLLSSLETHLFSVLGMQKVPDHVIISLASVLQKASTFYRLNLSSPKSQGPLSDTSDDNDDDGKVSMFTCQESAPGSIYGTTAEVTPLPRERFRRWCFDRLFLLASPASSALCDPVAIPEDQSTRISSLALPFLLSRCMTALSTYIADTPLRGLVPFSRVREEELVYVLSRLLEFTPATGAYLLAYAPSQHEINGNANAAIKSIISQSSQAHLFHIYPQLVTLVTLSRQWPSATDEGFLVIGAGEKDDQKFDARVLAGKCLEEIGKVFAFA